MRLVITRGDIFIEELQLFSGPGSSVGTATVYGLDGPGIESRCGARFSAPVQTSPGAHPVSYTTSTGSFPVVKSGQGVTLSPHFLLVPWSRKSRARPLLPLWAVQCVSACKRLHFTLQWFSYSRSIQLSNIYQCTGKSLVPVVCQSTSTYPVYLNLCYWPRCIVRIFSSSLADSLRVPYGRECI